MSRVKIGKHYFKPGGGANSILPVVAPADNKQGVILRTICLGSSGAAGLSQTALYADLAPPVVFGDPNCRAIAVYNAPSSSFVNTIVPYEIEVPAGLGVWVTFNGTGQAQITYDFVDV